MEKFLPEICTIQYGFPFDSAKFSTSEGMPLIRIRDVVRGYSETFTTEEYKEEYIVSKDDLLIGMDGEFNIAKWGETPALLNQRVCRLFPTSEVDKNYLFYFMPSALKRIEEKTPFVTVKHLSAKELNKVKVPLPPLDEQRRIAAVLDKVSDLIAKRRAQLDKLDLLVKARFVEMFEHVSDQVLLSDVAEVTGGLTKNSKRKDFPIKLPYLRVANVFFDTIDTNEILEIGLTEEEKRKTLLQNGDLLFVEGNGNPEQIGRVAVWQDEIVPCVHQNHLIKARFNLAKMLPTYAMNYFMTQKGREQIREKAVSTSGLYTLSVSKIESLHIPFAPMDRQLQFTDFKEKVDKSKLTIRQSLNKLETLKKALMQQYFG